MLAAPASVLLVHRRLACREFRGPLSLREGIRRALLVCAAASRPEPCANVCTQWSISIWYVPAAWPVVAVLARVPTAVANRRGPGRKANASPAGRRPIALGLAAILASVGGVAVAGRFGPALARSIGPYWSTHSRTPRCRTPQPTADPATRARRKCHRQLEQVVAWDPDHAGPTSCSPMPIPRFDLQQQTSDNAMRCRRSATGYRLEIPFRGGHAPVAPASHRSAVRRPRPGVEQTRLH